MSRILNRQRQLAEAGRLRLGYTQEYERNGQTKSRPVKSQLWIVTSHSQEIVEAAADLWGGTPEPWQPLGNGASQFRVITKASAIDAILPPGDPLTQAYETWSKGGAQRRCDGATEQFSGSPCLCIQQFGPKWYEQPKGRVCDTKTRLKVLLPDMPGLGSYRVETGSFYAADEIAGVVDFIRSAVGEQVLIPIRLRIEPRTRVAGGETKQFIVPVVELRGATTMQVLERADLMAEVGAAPARQQIAAAPATGRDWRGEADAAEDVETIKEIWRAASAAGQLDEALAAHLTARATALAPKGQPDPDVTEEPDGDVDAMWMECVAAAGSLDPPWTTDEVVRGFEDWSNGTPADDGDYGQFVGYRNHLRALKTGEVAA